MTFHQVTTTLSPHQSRLAGGAFALIGLGMLIGGIWWYQRAAQSAGWPTVPGTVTESRVESRRETHRRDGRTRTETKYEAEIRYCYTVESQSYTGDDVTFSDSSSSNRSRASSQVARYPVGADVTVYYDPADPASCVLEPGVTLANYILPVMGLLFLVIGTLALIGRLPGTSQREPNT